jgi:hypothetical protein
MEEIRFIQLNAVHLDWTSMAIQGNNTYNMDGDDDDRP